MQTYLDEPEVEQPPPIDMSQPARVGLSNATVTWPSTSEAKPSQSDEHQNGTGSSASSTTAKNNDGFILKDVSLNFPNGELSIICGSTGAGKTLLMLSLLGETTILNGQVFCPRQPIADEIDEDGMVQADISEKDWILEHNVAFVSQTGKKDSCGTNMACMRFLTNTENVQHGCKMLVSVTTLYLVFRSTERDTLLFSRLVLLRRT